jgi:alkylation response protein AidB-like acyl-CoA dehydrogenase
MLNGIPMLALPIDIASTIATPYASARTVDLAYEAGGASSIYSSSPLQRCFRDVHVATQHIMVAPGSLELAGRALLGIEGDYGQL